MRPPITFDNDTMSLNKWSKDPRCKVSRETLAKRIDEGMDPGEAMTAGRQSKPRASPADKPRIYRTSVRLPVRMFNALTRSDVEGRAPGEVARGGTRQGSRAGAVRAGLAIIAASPEMRAAVKHTAISGGLPLGSRRAARKQIDLKLTPEEREHLTAIAQESGGGLISDADVLRAAAMAFLERAGLARGLKFDTPGEAGENVGTYLSPEELERIEGIAVDLGVCRAQAIRDALDAAMLTGGIKGEPTRKSHGKGTATVGVALDKPRVEAVDRLAARHGGASRAAVLRAVIVEFNP